MRIWLPAVAALALHGCASLAAGSASAAPAPGANDWRTIATESDRERLRQWRSAWTGGLEEARSSGHGATLAREGALLEPDAALPWSQPASGNYRCRTIKIGSQSEGGLDYIAYPAFACRIRPEDGVTGFAKLSGSQRPIGIFLPDNSRRMVFLGTLQLGDETAALRYGRDRERDLAGFVERIGENRWRLVLPYPHFESTIDVIELIPSP